MHNKNIHLLASFAVSSYHIQRKWMDLEYSLLTKIKFFDRYHIAAIYKVGYTEATDSDLIRKFN
ncbi:hypothetical protein ASG93_12215 [Paenibacillus sp. Soil787]|nr:hypothetical protein ASG93_12215 [Paenibacillus sp. Soil787]